MSRFAIKWKSDMWSASLDGEGCIWLTEGLDESRKGIAWSWRVADYDRPPDFLAEGKEPTLERAKSKAVAAAKPLIDRIEKREREAEERRQTCPECRKKWKAHDKEAGEVCWKAIEIRRARELIAKVDGGTAR